MGEERVAVTAEWDITADQTYSSVGACLCGTFTERVLCCVVRLSLLPAVNMCVAIVHAFAFLNTGSWRKAPKIKAHTFNEKRDKSSPAFMRGVTSQFTHHLLSGLHFVHTSSVTLPAAHLLPASKGFGSKIAAGGGWSAFQHSTTSHKTVHLTSMEWLTIRTGAWHL